MKMVPDLSRRAEVSEMMDDFSITDDRLGHALRDLRYVNRFLGGVRAVRRELWPLVRRRRSIRILDVGTGLADIPEQIVTWGARKGVDIHITAIDANPATIAFARDVLDARMAPDLRERIVLRTGDALRLPEGEGAYDVATASLFLHHFYGDDAVRLLREMARVSTSGIIINDLHRHPISYAAVRAIAALMPVSEMFAHDGPASVRRAFTPEELRHLSESAGLAGARVRRVWAYRLTLSTISV